MPIVSFLLYALPGCAVYLTLAALRPSYHLYYVLLYNPCCSPKGFLKWEKKDNSFKACPEVIMYRYTSRGYAKWLQKKKTHSVLNVKDSKWGGKKYKGCWIYKCLMKYLCLSYEMLTHTQTLASRPGSFFLLAWHQVADSQLADNNIPVCRCSSVWVDTARNTSPLRHRAAHCLLAQILWSELKYGNNTPQCVVLQCRRESVVQTEPRLE